MTSLTPDLQEQCFGIKDVPRFESLLLYITKFTVKACETSG